LNTEWLRHAAGVDVIIHLAAQTSSYAAAEDPLADEAVNVRPVIALLEHCRRQSVQPFVVLASTVTITGIPAGLPVTDDTPPAPLTVYDLHKWMAEEYLKLAIRLGHARGTSLRLANVYGPGPRSSSGDRGVVNTMIRRALAGEAITTYGDGNWLRDYVYIDDVTAAFAAAVERPDMVNARHWIIATGEGETVGDAFRLVADRVAVRTGRRPPMRKVDPPAWLSPIEERHFIGDSSGFTAATGWRAEVKLAEGIDQTIAAFVAATEAPCKS
jgi:UDP-glucose 4-epimerase